MSRLRVLENKIKDALGFIRNLRDENKTLKNDNMKLFSELELLRNDVKSANRLRNEYEQITARDRKIREKVFSLKNKVDRLSI